MNGDKKGIIILLYLLYGYTEIQKLLNRELPSDGYRSN